MARYIGAALRRKEDARLLRGAGCFIADLRRPDALHATLVRSPHAHARIRRIDASRARARPGVYVLTAADLPPSLRPIPLRLTAYPGLTDALQYPLARDKVRYVGDPVAVVVAADRYAAEDAAEEVGVDYEPLPAVLSVAAALAEGAPVLHEALGHNVACAFEQRVGDIARAFAEAEVIVEDRFHTNRHASVPLECRGLLAEYDRASGRLTVWGAAKVPHFNRRTLAALLDFPEERIRLVELDVGGGFGGRGEFYPEDYLIPYLALTLGQPVAWSEDRREHLQAINHSREQEVWVRLAARRDGTLLGLHARIDNDHGAYVRTHGATVPEIGSALLPGPYRLPHFLAEVRCVLTNKTPTGTYRGPGRYEGTFVREVLLDELARRLALDPAELRRRNLITPAEMPYDVGTGGLAVHTVYDSGDYPALLDTALQAIDYAGFRARQAAERVAGRWRGVGIGMFVEKSGLGPWEYARVELTPEGRVRLRTGGSSVGQGLVTVMSQIVADGLGVPPELVDVVYGDTDQVARGAGAFASRVTVVGGAAAFAAARQLRERVLAVAARALEVAVADLDLAEGTVRVRGAPARALALAEVAAAAARDGMALHAEHVFETAHMAYPGGVHACIVEVDPETGAVRFDKYVIAYDIGRAVNPLLVEGQLQGGLAQGIGGALFEELAYSADGQLLAGTFLDYLLPTSDVVPAATIVQREDTPSPVSPLGVKGAGEGGCTGAGGAVANAVADALAPLGVRVRQLPLTPARIVALIAVARTDAP
ncbi:MAG TPA: xanthine dehydrogenase family protein molybdopterin-binding subunit [Chloroflexota bacterium]|jgi:carbon-monoxide dehydrogenase large subunit|nr:xanthine dehydrogenase family protein molybdopterin-binding subunit [Chloroflexota bacterium]